jgi:RNA polymerase sigma factor (sigma-70 family)
MNEPRIRVLVADDHAVVREGIRTVLEAAAEFEVVAEAANGQEALDLIERHDPDVAILDITMPDVSGIDVVKKLREKPARTGVLILSMHDHAEYVLNAVRAGADGYLLKNAGPAEVRDAVRAVAEGREAFSPRITQQLSSALRDEAARSSGRDRLQQLTPREREVLARVAAGKTSREIAEEFGISHRTVETHRESIMRKLQIRTVAGLTRFAMEAGIEANA